MSKISKEETENTAPERCYGGGTTVRGFMCLVDWKHEIGRAPDNKVYSSLETLQEDHTCWAECGMVEVEVRSIRIVVPEDHTEVLARLSRPTATKA
jgi:hypothetical protein